MEFFASAIDTLKILVIALGAQGIVNLLEGYGNDNPGAKADGYRHNPDSTVRHYSLQ